MSQDVHDLFLPNQLAQARKSLREALGGYAADVGIRGQLQNTIGKGIMGATENDGSLSLHLRGLSKSVVEETVANECMQNDFKLSSLGGSNVHAEYAQTRKGKPEDVSVRESSSSHEKRKMSNHQCQLGSQTCALARNVRARI